MTYLSWEWAFYLFGLVGALWFAAWQYIVSTRPQDHPRISAAELDFINSNAILAKPRTIRKRRRSGYFEKQSGVGDFGRALLQQLDPLCDFVLAEV